MCDRDTIQFVMFTVWIFIFVASRSPHRAVVSTIVYSSFLVNFDVRAPPLHKILNTPLCMYVQSLSLLSSRHSCKTSPSTREKKRRSSATSLDLRCPKSAGQPLIFFPSFRSLLCLWCRSSSILISRLLLFIVDSRPNIDSFILCSSINFYTFEYFPFHYFLYITSCVCFSYTLPYLILRSSSSSNLLRVPHADVIFGSRSFHTAAPTIQLFETLFLIHSVHPVHSTLSSVTSKDTFTKQLLMPFNNGFTYLLTY